MASTISSYTVDLINSFIAKWQQIPPWARTTSIFAISATGILTRSILNDYRRWKAIGAGGLPHNWKGYMMHTRILTKASRDTLTLSVYNQPEKYSTTWAQATEAEKAAAYVKFLKFDLPQRDGPQARAKPFVIPQRERNADEAVDQEVKEAYLAAFEKLHEENAAVTEWKTSVLEKRGRALFLKPFVQVPTLATQTHGEVCHVHASDLSGHVTLSFADAREAIAKGWCERHRLSGSEIIPLGYTMTFVPRSVEEVQVFVRLFQAGIDYMQNGK